jgi:hypothetical protein
MLLSVVGRYAQDAERDLDRYAAWSAALRRLKDDWQNGTRPEPGALLKYLNNAAAEWRGAALQDLVAEHLRLSWLAGPGRRLDDYIPALRGESPGLEDLASLPASLIEDEFLARYTWPHGDTPEPREYDERFARADVHARLADRCLANGRYVRLHLRGQGGMGAVWEAHDHHLRRRVAIKLPRRADAELQRRLADEARVTAGLEHAAIVTVHEYHEADGMPFYVMRLVDGQPFGERIRNYHQPPPEHDPGEQRLLWSEILRSYLAVCEAVAYAHARGVLHRDLKPGNVVVGECGETVILDWGMATRISAAGPGTTREAVTHLVVGTPPYMPPEQAEGMADPRSDVFGLGAILYEMLTNRPPHAWLEGARPADWLAQVRAARFPAPHCVRPAPRVLEAICLKALMRNPAERYQAAADLAADLRRYSAGEPTTVRSDPAWVRACRWLIRQGG